MPSGSTPRSETQFSQNLIAELRAELARRRLTAVWLADRIGRSSGFVGKALAGTGYLVLDDVVRACEVLDLPLEVLVARVRMAMAERSAAAAS